MSVILILIILVIGLLNWSSFKKAVYPLKYSDYVEKYAENYKIDKYLVYSIIKAESEFKFNARSEKGAVGLMQIMPSTGKEIAQKLGIENFSEEVLLNPEININIGCYYLSYLLNKYDGNIKTAVAAYNAGYGNVDNWLAVEQIDFLSGQEIPFGETKKYLLKVEKNLDNYFNIYEGEK
ncbi:MAG: lytic transglycosylase domain-containing protein [Clostridia bacterium]|nr:lytic transglycosylase domain-containing protein [Clostridia bacterium]